MRLLSLLRIFSVAALFAVVPPLTAQAPVAKDRRVMLTIDTLLASPGRPWTRYQSRHFELYTEYPGTPATVMLDSLEDALSHATRLIGMTVSDGMALTAFVTGSRTRFLYMMGPTNKGARTMMRDGRDVIVLVVNDSVRSYARHEVMHSVGFRTWGAQSGNAEWLSEGLATFADGLCQGVPIAVVARDVLREQPTLTVGDVTERFSATAKIHRHSAYVLAGSLIEFLWNTRGRDGMKRVWQGTDSLTESGAPSLLGAPASTTNITREWRAYVERTAGTRPGLSPTAFQRNGCG